MKKITVGIIFGGASSEHDVSTVSAKSVIEKIDKEKYNLVLIGITKQGEWFVYDGPSDMLPEDKWLGGSIRKGVISPDSLVKGIVTENGETIHLDVVLPVLHGKNGEDGTLQGLLQLAGIPFVGCNSTSSGVCMDKHFTNAVADSCFISQAKWCSFNSYEFSQNKEECLKAAEEKLGYPIFVKPANAGSSVGITKAHNISELEQGMIIAFKEDKKAVLEENIDGLEIECAVMGNENPICAEVGQIKPCNEFYDYEAKYINPDSELIIPANISEEKRKEVKELAVKVYKNLGCEGLSRVDFFVRKSDGKVLFNEINTLPGFTPISMYAKLFEAVGVSYTEVIDRLIGYAISRGDNY